MRRAKPKGLLVLAGYGWFMASVWATGGIRFDLAMDRAKGEMVTQAVYPKQNEYFHEPVTRKLSEVLRVDLLAGSPGKGGYRSARIVVTLKDGTQLLPFEGEDRGADNETLVLDRMQRMIGQAR